MSIVCCSALEKIDGGRDDDNDHQGLRQLIFLILLYNTQYLPKEVFNTMLDTFCQKYCNTIFNTFPKKYLMQFQYFLPKVLQNMCNTQQENLT